MKIMLGDKVRNVRHREAGDPVFGVVSELEVITLGEHDTGYVVFYVDWTWPDGHMSYRTGQFEECELIPLDNGLDIMLELVEA